MPQLLDIALMSSVPRLQERYTTASTGPECRAPSLRFARSGRALIWYLILLGARYSIDESVVSTSEDDASLSDSPVAHGELPLLLSDPIINDHGNQSEHP
jgi:hypothetical protein